MGCSTEKESVLRCVRICHCAKRKGTALLPLFKTAHGPRAGVLARESFEDEIIEAVTEAVRYQAQVAVDTKRLWEQEQSQIEQKQRGFEGQIRECVAEQKALSTESVALYERFVDGGLTHDEYIRQKSGLSEKLEQARREETEIRSQLADLSNTRSEGIMKYQGLLDTDSLTQEQICGLLERVTIFPEGRLEIKLRLVDENKVG